MSNRRPSPEHQEAVSRRLALLSAELAGARAAPDADPDADPDDGWSAGHTRIRTLVPVPDVADEPDVAPPRRSADEAPLVPLPGRHASRRAAALMPSSLRGRVALGPAQVAVVAVVVAVGLVVTCWWLVRGDPDRLEAPTLDPSPVAMSSGGPLADVSPVAAADGAETGTGATGTGAGAAETGRVTVDVAGKVRRPGIAVLDAGDRVVDALKAAGGARPGVDLSGLNLARVLVDGEQILVGQPAPTGLAASAVPAAGAPAGPLVNLNTAAQAELESLPEVGPVTALAIVTWRDEHGGFSSVDELLEVSGIGDATLSQLAPYVTV